MLFVNRRIFLVSLVVATSMPCSFAWAQTTAARLEFTTHAAFFSQETRQSEPIDPQVFVKDANAKAGNGPQNIQHIDGFRPAHLADPANTPVFTAQGKALGFKLGQWLGPRGKLTLLPQTEGATVQVRLSGLIPNGIYSLFENHFDQKPVGFTPLDGKGTTNSFKADGKGVASLTVHASQMPTNVNAVLVVYHSDHLTHGESRGEIGITAHHQMLAKIP